MEAVSALRRWWFWLKVGPPLFLAMLVLLAVMGAAVGQTGSTGLVAAAAPPVGDTGSPSVPHGALAPYAETISQAAQETGVEPELIEAVIMAESGGDPNALSPAGAMGLMQLMPDTAQALGVGNPWDPEENILGGSRHLAGLLQAAPTWPVEDETPPMWLAVAAYNAGEGAVRKYHGIPPYPETQGYVVTVAGYYEGFKALALASAGGEPDVP